MHAPRHNRPKGLRILLLLVVACGPFTQIAKSQDGVNEQTAISGNHAVIVVTVRESSGEPLSVAAVVRLYRSEGIPNGQSTTTAGRAIFTPQNLGEFTVVVEAPGYKTGRGQVSVPIPIKAEIDVYMQPESATEKATGVPGNPVLAPKAKEAVDKALEALRANDLAEADKYLSSALKLAPSHPDVLYLQGVLYMRRDKWSEAQAVLEKATQVDPSHSRALAALGTALCNQGKYELAIEPLEKSLRIHDAAWETHWTLAKAYYYHKQYDAALKTSQQALLESDGKAPEIELLVAQSLTAVGRYEESAQMLRDFLKTHGDHAEAPTARRWLERLESAGKIRRE